MSYLKGWWGKWAKKKLVPMAITGGLFALMAFIAIVAMSSVNQVKQNQLDNRNCESQLILGGTYSSKPECQYTGEGGSLAADLKLAISGNRDNERLIRCAVDILRNIPSSDPDCQRILEQAVQQFDTQASQGSPGARGSAGSQGSPGSPGNNGNNGNNGGNGNGNVPDFLSTCVVGVCLRVGQ